MEITDVIRGEEWLPSTAHHVLLYRAFGWEDTMPTFSHLPLILKPNGQGKLSKRDGQKFGFPVFPMAWPSDNPLENIEGFDSYGFEPGAVINFLALLGWNPGTEQEIFSLSELIEEFDPARIHKAGARFDFEKALWFNHQYIQQLHSSDVESRLKEYAALHDIAIDGSIGKVFDLLKPRLHTLKELFVQGYYFFSENFKYDDAEISKKWVPELKGLLDTIASGLSGLEQFTEENASLLVKEMIASSGIKMGNCMPVLRASLTGTIQGPDVFAIASILGKEKTIDRIRRLNLRMAAS
jgi:glutamyl-tRNA synthetase